MNDLYGILGLHGAVTIDVFNRPTKSDNVPDLLTWAVPRGALMCAIICIPGGGGGGGGCSGAAASARGGGGGGGSANMTRGIFAVHLLPSILYVSPGAGAQGGAAGAPGSGGGSGVISRVGISRDNTDSNILIKSSNAGPGGGNGGTASAGGAGGSNGSSPASNVFQGLGHLFQHSGQSGAAGGAHTGANGTAIAIPVSGLLTTGGSGGGGTTSADFTGGPMTSISNSWLSEQRPSTPATGSFPGSGGRMVIPTFFNFGGLGGSSSNTGVGGDGGNGGPGCGGGGGGAGTTGGRGGDGGTGVIVIACW